MPPDMQDAFHQMSDDILMTWAFGMAEPCNPRRPVDILRGCSVQEYLKLDGAFAFVLPNAALDRVSTRASAQYGTLTV
jgi:hypothetical protein